MFAVRSFYILPMVAACSLVVVKIKYFMYLVVTFYPPPFTSITEYALKCPLSKLLMQNVSTRDSLWVSLLCLWSCMPRESSLNTVFYHRAPVYKTVRSLSLKWLGFAYAVNLALIINPVYFQTFPIGSYALNRAVLRGR